MFKYVAQVNWPRPQPQLDWIDQVIAMENWLNLHVGDGRWLWAQESIDNPGQACIAFKYAKHKTLFLINYS